MTVAAMDAAEVEAKWVRLEAAHKRTGIPPAALADLIKEGALPATKVGRLYHVKLSDLDAFMESRAVTPRLREAQAS